MTLPAMKIWTGGDREYSERVQRALFEYGLSWPSSCDTLMHSYANYIFARNRARESISAGYAGEGCFSKNDEAAYRLAANGNLVPAEADDDGWIEWSGGECPVDGPLPLVAYLRNGCKTEKPAKFLRWGHCYDGADIIAYCIPSMIFPTSQCVTDSREQEAEMSETLTAAEALRGPIADGFEAGDENPWARVEALSPSGSWRSVIDAEHFELARDRDAEFRRKPRTVRVEGEISEEDVYALQECIQAANQTFGGSLQHRTVTALINILNAVKYQ